MKEVLLIAAYTPGRIAVAEAVRRLHEAGATVYLAGMTDVESTHADLGLDGLRSLRLPAEGYGAAFFRTARRGIFAEEIWAHVQRDPWVRKHARRAQVLVALHNPAVYSVWRLAQQYPRAEARFGLTPAVEAVLERNARSTAAAATEWVRRSPRPAQVTSGARAGARRSARTVVRRAATVSRAVAGARLPMWRRLLLSPRLSERARAELAVEVISGLQQTTEGRDLDILTAAVVDSLRTPRARADLLGGLVMAAIAAGAQPRDVVAGYAAELRYADSLLAKKDTVGATDSLLLALRMAFHRAVHLDSTLSPLAADPAGFTAPLRESTTFRAVTAQSGREQQAAGPPTDRPLRLLIATNGNTNFIGELQALLAAHPNAELRIIDPTDVGRAKTLSSDPRRMVEPILSGSRRAVNIAEREIRPHLDWADVLFVDWCTSFARLLTLVDPGTTRVMVRLHSYEAFTMWPVLLDLSRIDDLIFVSEHVRDLTVAQLPALTSAQRPAIHVIPNAMDLKRVIRPKTADARFTIAMIGFQVVAKDVRWAVQVLRLVRAQDARYRLLLIGSDFQTTHSPAAAAYGAAFQQDLDELEPIGAITRFGHADDVGEPLAEAGTILCSSVREGSPVGLLEAAASGAVPVVRDWPFFAAMPHGPRTLYPPDWVVDTPEQAADRILSVTADEDRWQQESGRSSAEVLRRWDLSVVDDDYERLIFG
ncbi:hypothetical protein GCM10009841_23040 [Microlunatus panaciterrae]|uniref:Glycosyltransferase involved in cell wall biosynthesis n=1 Tax=Microlunatus panaciterrae TaxID=400768 RepID=A0ABS2RDX1_9ACTN|nr:glycosyltransferase [Microlunatus panaciterrae]MBM7797186.1 glycosyltransferase involved in cell wall biosynthesis [Microlunatus panaciterrae]